MAAAQSATSSMDRKVFSRGDCALWKPFLCAPEEQSEGPSMNADGFAQVPDLDNQCNTSSSVAAGSHRLPSARHLQVNEMNNMFSQFTPQASYLGQEGDNPFSQLQPMHSIFIFPHLVSSDDPWFSPKARKTVTLPLTTSHSLFTTRFR